jgi:hypothetical protein
MKLKTPQAPLIQTRAPHISSFVDQVVRRAASAPPHSAFTPAHQLNITAAHQRPSRAPNPPHQQTHQHSSSRSARATAQCPPQTRARRHWLLRAWPQQWPRSLQPGAFFVGGAPHTLPNSEHHHLSTRGAEDLTPVPSPLPGPPPHRYLYREQIQESSAYQTVSQQVGLLLLFNGVCPSAAWCGRTCARGGGQMPTAARRDPQCSPRCFNTHDTTLPPTTTPQTGLRSSVQVCRRAQVRAELCVCGRDQRVKERGSGLSERRGVRQQRSREREGPVPQGKVSLPACTPCTLVQHSTAQAAIPSTAQTL